MPQEVEPAEGEDEEPERAEREAMLIAQRVRELVDAKTQVRERDAKGILKPRDIRFGDIVLLLRSMKFKCDQFAAAEQIRRPGN